MKHLVKVLLKCLILLGISIPLYAQQESINTIDMFNKYTSLLSPEKVYLHTDKDVYFATDTIWLSGYVENVSSKSEFPESNYIYVELISDQLYRSFNSLTKFAEYETEVVVRKKIKRDGRNFQGYIVVPEMISTDRAILRAYTYWMLNRPAEYMFYKELELANPMKDKLIEAMDKRKDKRRDDYLLIGEKALPDRLKELNNIDTKYDVQFLPESGISLVKTNAIMYIKANDVNGAGASVFGEVLDSKDKVIAKYTTDSLGFGCVTLPFASVEKLKATVKDALGSNVETIKLPVPLYTGVAINGRLHVEGKDCYSNDDKIYFAIKTTEDLLNNTLRVILSNGSELCYNKVIESGNEFLSFPLKTFSPGIHSISVVNAQGNVYAQRPFIVLPEEKETLTLSADKKEYKKRERVEVKIKVPKEMLDASNNFSVAVTDMSLSANCEKTTMLSYMLLKSELKGYIENIDWYFNDSVPLSTRMLRADLLMQTHGWRYYDIEKILKGKTDAHYFGREYMQTLFGKVKNPLGLTKKATVSFLAPTMKFTAMGQIDSGYFELRDVSFPEDTRFIVSAVGKNGKSKIHTPILQNDYFAPIYEYPKKGKKVIYTPLYQGVVESIYYSKDDGEHAMVFELNPVVVTSKLIIPKDSPSIISNYPIRKDWYRDSIDMKPYTKSHTIGMYVVNAFSGVSLSSSGNALYGPKITPATSMRKPGRTGLVQVFLNKMYLTPQEVVSSDLLNKPVSDFESIIYVSGLAASPFQPYSTANDYYPSPVLMLKTKPYVGADEAPFNVTSSYPIGWQIPSKFYSPKYDTPEAKKSKVKDNRITLYWNPSVQLDENGEASIQFYTSDSDSKFRVEVEGRSGYKQYHYSEKIIEMVSESDIK